MAIRIPILTSFDPKGLKQANAQFGKLQSSIGSLGRNFAAAGAVIAGAGALIGRAVADAAESQKVFAQTEAVLKSMGTTANGTAQDISNLASSLQKSTAFSDEAILAGQNLLLTFKNIQNQAGAGNDIFDQTSTLMLDVARAMGTSASGEAIRLGKALNDPVKGISALTRVGIQFTDQQKSQIKALAESGDLMGAQKIILAELQQQFGGSAAAYAGTFAGQLEGLNNDLNDLSEEIGFMVMPAVQDMITEFRNLIPIIGPQLKAAIESVDWKALTQSVIGFTTFLIKNGQAIANTIIAIFALNTAFKLMAVASGIAKTAIAVKTWYLAQLTAGMTASTIAAGVLRTALLTMAPFAVVAGLTLIGSAMVAVSEDARLASDEVTNLYETVKAEQIADPWKQAANPTKVYIGLIRDAKVEAEGVGTALKNIPRKINTRIKITTTTAYDSAETRRLTEQAFGRGSLDMSLGKWEEEIETGAGKGGAKAGKAAGKAFADSASKTISKYQQQINDAIEKSLASVPIQDTWKESGNTIGNSIISGIQKSFTEIGKLGPRLVNEYGKQLKIIYDRTAKLQEAFIARTDFQVKLKQDIMGMFDFKTIKTGLTGIINQFKNQVEQTRKFRDNLAELQKLGLSGDLFRQIAEGQDFNTAAELVKGGAAAVNEVNSLFGSLTGFADEIATISGNSLYNLGVDAATGYVRTLEDGFADLQRQQKLESQKALIASEIQAISTKLSSGVADPALRADLEARKAELLESRNRLFGEGGAKVGGRFGRELRNLGIRTGLDQYFLGGGQMNSNIANQLAYLNLGSTAASVADREARALQRAQGRASAQGISVNVNGGISTSAQIGQAVIDAIRAYERASGQVYARA